MGQARRPAFAAAVLLAAAAVAACHQPQEPLRSTFTGTDVLLPAETLLVRGVVPPRTTLDALLRSQGLDPVVVARVVESASRVFDLRRLRSLHPFQLERTIVGALRRFEYEIDDDSRLSVQPVDRASQDLKAEVLPIPKTLQAAAAAAEITTQASSLFAAMKAAGEGDDLAIAVAAIFSGEIDFNTEVQRGDRLAVVFERVVREGRPGAYGDVSAAQFVNEGRVLQAIRFTPPGGRPGYYDAAGRSLKRFFLKSPLKFEPRVTSGFSLRRMHPVLHTARAHQGVDYAAAPGSPVVAVAPGTVVSASYDDSSGRMVRLRHSSGYESYYMHLSGFARGIQAGAHVDQAEVIGYVGATGLATGPHLHYGLAKNGAFVNPIAEHKRMPPGEPIPASVMAAFGAVRDRALADLAAAVAPAPQMAQK
jgi:murein DD-endopeptidase MepM/ murein hydrolase activator NlpD